MFKYALMFELHGTDFIINILFSKDKLVPFLKKALLEFYGENPKESESYGRVINSRHFKLVCFKPGMPCGKS